MKKTFCFLCGLCLFAAACQEKENQLVLTGKNISLSGDLYVYDPAENKPVDTIAVQGGNFTYARKIAGEPKLLLLTDGNLMMHYLIAEEGNLSLTGDTGLISGSPLNNRLAELTRIYRHTGEEIEQKKEAIFDSLGEEEELSDEQMRRLQELEKELSDQIAGAMKKFYNEDKASVLGVFELILLQGALPAGEFVSLYEQGGEAVRNFPPFIKLQAITKNAEKTETGAACVDFEGVDPNNPDQILRLSGFVGKDSYILLDFWASWCGPCRKAMPEIKRLNDTYAGKGLKVIGVVVGDQIENHLQAAKDLNVTWTQIFDAKNVIAPLYGISGVPTLILLDKDGLILLRTNDDNEIVEKVRELLGAE
jgi:thiol-disulfide isomerase/thioredoxin